MRERQVVWHGKAIRTWAEFHRVVKRPGRRLLERLDDFGPTILVAGCQRSGTTAVSRLLRGAAEIVDHSFGHDDELDAALLLAGHVGRFSSGRHCFQTTYLNDRFPEYFEHGDFRLIWVLREPRSVVRSMLYNWKRAALNRLFEACGSTSIDGLTRGPSLAQAWFGPAPIVKACASYVAKTSQTFALRERLGSRMLIVDYEDLVLRRLPVVRELFDFLDVPFDSGLITQLHGRSLRGGERLTRRQAERIDDACTAVYHEARRLVAKEYAHA